MTGPALERSATNLLILILPFALAVVFLYSVWPLLLGIAVLGMIWQVWQYYQWKQWSKQVNPFFTQLLQDNQGCLTAVDLSLKANITLEAAKRFLERKASEYGAQKKEYEKGIVYYFLTASALGRIFDASEPTLDVDTEAMSAEEVSHLSNYLKPGQDGEMTIALIQAELAKRLDVHSGTISKRKGTDDFAQWSQKKDPEGIAWKYAEKQKLFIPLEH